MINTNLLLGLIGVVAWLMVRYHWDFGWLLAAVIEWLRRARKARGWTIEQAAEAVGVDWTTYSRWERGKQRPQFRNMYALEKVFGMDAEAVAFAEFLRWSDELYEQMVEPLPMPKERAAMRLAMVQNDMLSRRFGCKKRHSRSKRGYKEEKHMYGLTIWTALRNARKARGWTIEKAAEQVGIDVSSYHRWELGQHRPYPTNARQLVEALQTNHQGEMICLYGTPLTVSIQQLTHGLVREGIDYKNVQILIQPGRYPGTVPLQCIGRVNRVKPNTHTRGMDGQPLK